MSVKKDLKKEGIDIISKVDTLTVNSISKSIANKLCKTFPELDLNVTTLFRKISRLEMYYAKLPQNISAKYFYKNKSIYFDYKLSLEKISEVSIHECIHYLQERCDKNGNIYRLGLCDYTNSKLPGTGLNEAAVQLMATKCMKSDYENVKYFGINIPTNTEAYYPLECTLVNQMAYLIGENVLFESTLNSNDSFKEQYISLTSEKAYKTIQKNIDMLVEKQDTLNELYEVIQLPEASAKFTNKCIQEIEKGKESIRNLFMDTQKLILTSYFDNTINLTYTPKLIENYRNKLYLYKNLLGQMEGDNFFNDYYIDKMVQLEKRYDLNNTEIRDLVVVKNNFISTLFRKIRTLFGLSGEYARVKE